MVFLIHPLPADFASRPVKVISDPRQTDELEHGDLVQAWGHTFAWNDSSLPHRELDRYAKRADPAIDEWLASLPPDALHHQDTLLALAAAAERGDEKALVCWNEVTRTAPVGVRVTEEEWAAGSTFFWENAGLIFTSLLHFSLAGGFSAPRITRHLHAASYLIPPVDKTGLSYCPMSTASRDRTRGRLAETGQFVLDVMGCPLPLPDSATEKEKAYVATRLSLGVASLTPPPKGSFSIEGTGEAWQGSTRVRLLHGVSRRRVTSKLDLAKGNNLDDGKTAEVALNQEDMLATLASFAVAPLWCLERLGVASPVLSADAEGDGRRSYIRLWRHVGLYLGIPEEILASHFSGYLPAGSLLASVVVNLFPPSGSQPPTGSTTPSTDEPPKEFATTSFDVSLCPVSGPHPTLPPPTLPVLQAIADQPPIGTSLEYHEGLTRLLVGDELANYLGLSEGTFASRLKLRASVGLLVYPSWFASVYPSQRWRDLRRSTVREALGRVIKMQLRARRSVYRPRDALGLLSDDAMEDEKISIDPEGAKRLGKRYWRMVGEMMGVTAGVLICAVSLTGHLLVTHFR